MSSLRGRLSGQLLFSLLVVFALQWLVISYIIHQVTEDYVVSRLEHDADSLLAAVTFNTDEDGREEMLIPPSSLPSIYQQPFSGHYFVVINGGRTTRSRSLWDFSLMIDSVGVGWRLRFNTTGPQQQKLLVLQQGFRKQGRELTIAVAEDVSDVEQDILDFQYKYLGLSLLFMLLLIALQVYGIHSALLPLEHSRSQIQDLMHGRTDRLNEKVPLEIQPLIQEINRLLELINRRLAHTRTAIGNLAHALKTPLTVLRQLPRQEVIPPSVVEEMDRQVTGMQSMIDRELKLARMAGSGPAGAGLRPIKDLSSLIDVVARIHPSVDFKFSHDNSVRTTAYDREDLMECLGNLLDNAGKWARRQVHVHVKAHEGLQVMIEDDGPGCSETELEKLGKRGVRLDESVDGHGLGLSICQGIVAHYGGDLMFARSEKLGGLRVTVDLPPPRHD